jgi:hypothetical protein
MPTDILIHATGLCALAVNVIAMIHTCERSFRVRSGIAGMIWALNNLLLGAYSAAALSLVSAGRTATSAAVMRSEGRLRRRTFLGFAVLTLAVGVLTWDGWPSACLITASLLSTYAMFCMSGRSLRWSMLIVSALWMYHAWANDSWEQMAANAITGAAALYGAWRIDRCAELPAQR